MKRHVDLVFFVEHARAEDMAIVHTKVVESGGRVMKVETVDPDCSIRPGFRLEARFDDMLKAAVFLAPMGADCERAAMFKMFWSGE